MVPSTRVPSELENAGEREHETWNYLMEVMRVVRPLEQCTSHSCSFQLGKSCVTAACCPALVSCALVVPDMDSML